MKSLVLSIPGDKSISHRAILLGSLAQGTTKIQNLLEGEDVLATIQVMRELGVVIQKKGKLWLVKGKGIEAFKAPSKILDCGNSGTTMRLLIGLLSGCPFTSTLTGDDSLNKRPMGRVMEPLKQMGAEIREYHQGRKRFIEVQGRKLIPARFKIPVASAQVKSAQLLAGLSSGVEVSVTEPLKSRDHTERMLKAMKAKIKVNGKTVILKPCKLIPLNISVPSDFSSAIFFLVAALINKDPKIQVRVEGVGMNPTRSGGLEILKKMGAKIQVMGRRVVGGEPVANLIARPSQLRAVKISGAIIPRLIDEIPILCVAAAVAQGKTIIRDAAELRVKESDRIRSMAVELSRFGVKVKELPDGLEIVGTQNLKGATGQSYGDHRVAMSLAILGTITKGKTIVQDTDCIETSFPNFEELLNKFL